MSAPSVTEVEAALADVKVRAVPIARRRAQTRRAGIALGLVIAGIGGVAVGRLSPATSLAASPFSPPGVATVSVVPLGHPAEVTPNWRWHLTAWSEMDGLRYNEGEAWVDGPSGTGVQFSKYDEQMSYSGSIDAVPVGHSVQIRVQGTAQTIVEGPGAIAYTARLFGTSEAQIMPGQGVLFAPFGDKVGGRVLIDGPYAIEPTVAPRWHVQNRVLYATSSVGPLSVRPEFRPEPGLLRFSLRGSHEGLWEHIATSPAVFMMPGLGDSLQVSASYVRPGHVGELCLLLRSGLVTSHAREDGFGCFPNPTIQELEVSLGQHIFVRIERPSPTNSPD